MKKITIKKLAEASYSKDSLDTKKVTNITKHLKREDLKVYINDLKNLEAKKTVFVAVPNEGGISEMKDYFFKIYPNKKVVFNIDPSLLTGIRVVDYDNVYELSLKSFLEHSLRSATND